jgi:hypothetical protein
MPDWFLVPCLVQLRTEFNTLSPNRDKGADGSIGDTATRPSRPPTTTRTRSAGSSPSTSTRPGRGRRTSTPS